ncbi:hypothetical protein EDB89DRAFT_340152 [Lactarius sanguifluus]|nr:hypothetical protein EDB89DRAFT_340152 [Lactarius sanguifluus]
MQADMTQNVENTSGLTYYLSLWVCDPPVPLAPVGAKRGRGRPRGSKSKEGSACVLYNGRGVTLPAPPAVDTNSRLSAIEASLTALNTRFDRTDTDISTIKRHQEKQVESLVALERTQRELKKMVLMLCGYHAVLAAPTAPSASTSSTASRIVRFATPSTDEGSSTSSAQSGRADVYSFIFEVPYSYQFNTVRQQAGNLGQSGRVGLDCARRPDHIGGPKCPCIFL